MSARRITFPLAAPGMIAAAIFSFITSFRQNSLLSVENTAGIATSGGEAV
ncbi:hypothetical protein [Streptomyces caelestis]|jgi:ABC-type spermidine/putrescine transport system permease subunit II|uniref:ABC-type spermidine/putrescine transport system permease subunit II n=1 Tax=Streptomyces caelestis TaxID=36816 RepID=A0A7W9GYZ9_9ACTN|nr:hypothetical protein [Streptomyces caelestis]MBB5792246.1 ABC-type spermidine/putrescine transport system permease subunit II [Streptomyces caelestis]GGW82889.1 hypothetical protein GCM10010320_76000 [Streptomyces caelestis]